MRPRRFRATLLAVLLGCGSTAPDIGHSADLNVLFIGNSLTSTNDIPELVAGLGEVSGGPQVRGSEVSFGNFSLEDHWNQGDALEAIDWGGWDYVVMQQGPSTLPESRQNLLEWAGRFAERIRAVGPPGDLHGVAVQRRLRFGGDHSRERGGPGKPGVRDPLRRGRWDGRGATCPPEPDRVSS